MSVTWSRTLLAVMVLTADEARANSIWPFAAMYMQQTANFWTIGIALVVEFLVVWKLFSVTPTKALAADILMNVASALGGIMIMAALGWVGFSVFGEQIVHMFKDPTERAAVLAINFILLCAINALIEGGVLKWVFKLPIKVRGFGYLLMANSVGVAASFVGLWLATEGQPWLNPKSFI